MSQINRITVYFTIDINRALARYPTAFVVPVYQAALLVVPPISGAVYFGDIDTMSYDDPGNPVSGTLTSPAITIPDGWPAAFVEFAIFQLKSKERATINSTFFVIFYHFKARK